jgi:hypothetical protein
VKIIVLHDVTLCGLVETNVPQEPAASVFRSELFFLKIETVDFSETLKNIYETRRHLSSTVSRTGNVVFKYGLNFCSLPADIF